MIFISFSGRMSEISRLKEQISEWSARIKFLRNQIFSWEEELSALVPGPNNGGLSRRRYLKNSVFEFTDEVINLEEKILEAWNRILDIEIEEAKQQKDKLLDEVETLRTSLVSQISKL